MKNKIIKNLTFAYLLNLTDKINLICNKIFFFIMFINIQ